MKETDASVKDFVETISRGGLLHPTEAAFGLCMRGWQTFCQLRRDKALLNTFLGAKGQQTLFCSIVAAMIEESDDSSIINGALACEAGHDFGRSLMGRLFNCVIKNLMKKLTIDCAKEKAQSSKRKRLSTV